MSEIPRTFFLSRECLNQARDGCFRMGRTFLLVSDCWREIIRGPTIRFILDKKRGAREGASHTLLKLWVSGVISDQKARSKTGWWKSALPAIGKEFFARESCGFCTPCRDGLPWSAQVLDDIVNGRPDRDYWFLPVFDSIIEHDLFRSMRKSGREVEEKAVKLKDMRERLHGTWSERVPWVDNSRRPSVPLPQSSATPWKEAEDRPPTKRVDWNFSPRRVDWKFAPGKKLVGNMVMRCPERNSTRSRCRSDDTVSISKKQQ